MRSLTDWRKFYLSYRSYKPSVYAHPMLGRSIQMTSTPTIVVQNFLEFLQKSPSPFHAVKECQNLLSKSGFQKLDEKVSWEPILKAGGRYFFQRNGSTIVAFTLGTKYQAGQGFYVIGAHTDSPCLKVASHTDDELSRQRILG